MEKAIKAGAALHEPPALSTWAFSRDRDLNGARGNLPYVSAGVYLSRLTERAALPNTLHSGGSRALLPQQPLVAPRPQTGLALDEVIHLPEVCRQPPPTFLSGPELGLVPLHSPVTAALHTGISLSPPLTMEGCSKTPPPADASHRSVYPYQALLASSLTEAG
ncbi:hypothetical protein NDU88_004774 [Pleurodeles waltl]|uniref:Uncharacterized protein n=1 Tax=Pleurodeles waltl TaxID=8319 RepID=A0AAV7RJ66_PLEWA|nr:hypothetical protein NDU88_004774 [Pleurodeles waltl]